MKIAKIVLSLVLGILLFISCKDATSKASIEKAQTKNELAVATKPETASIKIEGMTCAIGCAKTIEKKLAQTSGVQKATVDFETKMATINFDADKISQKELIKTIESAADGETYKVTDVKTLKTS